MACYHPIPALQTDRGQPLRLLPPVGTANLQVPCGKCLGCRTDRALEWARRAQHEASTWTHNCFLTLTYSDKELPANGALQPQALAKFLKRLRRARDRRHPALVSDRTGSLRYLACGEYGERTSRPHYHLCLFNCDFVDLFAVGKDLFESPLVNQLWPAGGHRLGALTGASANYVAQYTVKAIGKTYHTEDGELLPSPFIRCSTKPALGHPWLKKYASDLQHGYLIADAHKNRVPRAYKKMLQHNRLKPKDVKSEHRRDRQLAETIAARATRRRSAPTDRTQEDELRAREHIHQQQRARSHSTL